MPKRPATVKLSALLLALGLAAARAGEAPPPGSGTGPAKPPPPRAGTAAGKADAAAKPPARGRELSFRFHGAEMTDTPTGRGQERAAVLAGSAWLHVEGEYGGRAVSSLLEADRIAVLHDRRDGRLQAWAQGAVRLTDRDGRLLCAELFYDFRTHRGRATQVRLEIGAIEEVSAGGDETAPSGRPRGEDRPGTDPAEDRWLIGIAREAPRKWYASAREIRRAGPGRWVLVRPRISSCSFEEPHWSVRASSANYLPGRRLESFNNVLAIGDLPLLYLPYLARDLEHDYPWTHWQFGDSSRWGPHVLSKWGFDLPSGEKWVLRPKELFLDADWRRDRGFAYGADLAYGARPHGGGLIDTYFLREDHISAPEDRERAAEDVERRTEIYSDLRAFGAPKVLGRPKLLYGENVLYAQRRALDGWDAPDLSPQTHADEQRFRLSLVHRQDFFPSRSAFREERTYKLDFTVEYQDWSDRDFAREYFRDEYRSGPPPVSYAMLRSQSDVMSTAVVVQPRVDPFLDQTEYLPELRFDIPQRALPGGFYLASAGSVGSLARRFDEDSGLRDLDAGRAHLQLVGYRPFRLGPLAFSPYVGTDQAWYSEYLEGKELIRGAALYGADSSLRLYGVYDVQSERFNVHGLRHVVEPRLFFRGCSDATHETAETYDFDWRDDLYKSNVAGAGLFQKVQVKRRDAQGVLRPADLLGLDYSASGFVDEGEAEIYNHGDMLLPMELRAFVNPTDRLRLWGRVEIDAHGAGLTASASGLTYSLAERLALSLGYRTIAEDPDRDIHGSRYLSARLDVALGELYRLSAAARYEFEEPDEELGERGLDNARLELSRNMHCWRLAVGWSLERRDDETNRSITASVTPVGRPRNLVKGSDQLLRDVPDYSRLPWRACPGEAAGALRALPPEEPPEEAPVPEDGDEED